MKFLRLPLSLVAFALFGVFLFAIFVTKLWHISLPAFWWWFPIAGGAFLLCAFLLQLLHLQWEMEVFVQVAIVLAPVLYFIDNRAPDKQPVYVFVVGAGYTGHLDIRFSIDKDSARTRIREDADTLYFRFESDGRVFLNEDFHMIRDAMRKRLFYYYPDGSKRRITFYDDRTKLPSDTTKEVLVEDEPTLGKGRVVEMHYRLNYPQKLK